MTHLVFPGPSQQLHARRELEFPTLPLSDLNLSNNEDNRLTVEFGKIGFSVMMFCLDLTSDAMKMGVFSYLRLRYCLMRDFFHFFSLAVLPGNSRFPKRSGVNAFMVFNMCDYRSMCIVWIDSHVVSHKNEENKLNHPCNITANLDSDGSLFSIQSTLVTNVITLHCFNKFCSQIMYIWHRRPHRPFQNNIPPGPNKWVVNSFWIIYHLASVGLSTSFTCFYRSIPIAIAAYMKPCYVAPLNIVFHCNKLQVNMNSDNQNQQE